MASIGLKRPRAPDSLDVVFDRNVHLDLLRRHNESRGKGTLSADVFDALFRLSHATTSLKGDLLHAFNVMQHRWLMHCLAGFLAAYLNAPKTSPDDKLFATGVHQASGGAVPELEHSNPYAAASLAVRACQNLVLHKSTGAAAALAVSLEIDCLSVLIKALQRVSHPELATAAASILSVAAQHVDLSGSRYAAAVAASLMQIKASSGQDQTTSAISMLTAAARDDYACILRVLPDAAAVVLVSPSSSHAGVLDVCGMLHALASRPENSVTLDNIVTADLIAALNDTFRELPRSLWGEAYTGLKAWRVFEDQLEPLPSHTQASASSSSTSGMHVRRLFDPTIDLPGQAGEKFYDAMMENPVVRERELKLRVEMGEMHQSEVVSGCNDGAGAGAAGASSSAASVPAPSGDAALQTASAIKSPSSIHTSIDVLRKDKQQRALAVQRRDAALVTIAILSSLSASANRIKRMLITAPGLLHKLAAVLDSPAGIDDLQMYTLVTLQNLLGYAVVALGLVAKSAAASAAGSGAATSADDVTQFASLGLGGEEGVATFIYECTSACEQSIRTAIATAGYGAAASAGPGQMIGGGASAAASAAPASVPAAYSAVDHVKQRRLLDTARNVMQLANVIAHKA